jgi:hypothetical protein
MIDEATEIELPCYGIVVNLTGDGGGSITSNLKDEWTEADPEEEIESKMKYNAAVDGLESLILGHACAGINIESIFYIEGIETAAQAIGNEFS